MVVLRGGDVLMSEVPPWQEGGVQEARRSKDGWVVEVAAHAGAEGGQRPATTSPGINKALLQTLNPESVKLYSKPSTLNKT